MTKEELASEIADCGGWEEWNQRNYGNWKMFDFYKARRLKLEQEYREKYLFHHENEDLKWTNSRMT